MTEISEYVCNVCSERIGTRPAVVVVPMTDDDASWRRTLNDAWTGIIVHDVCLPPLARP